ncbi:aspartate--tRNA ligase [Halobacteriovorax marinus]|uniref:Aspartate--tRNA ligase n=1 Tax=Halobacteriovorax marinus TaxID=97084 RepID=A0A1Y5F690_9BACT|nr:aspartate--tRNA ligase [Halobacteriovorax marinus]
MSELKGLLRTHNCGELREDQVGQTVTLCGWVNKYRDLGALHFIDLRDKYGLTQLGFEQFEGDLTILKDCALESVIKATGVVALRPDAAKNKKMDTGLVEIQVKSLEILSRNDIDNIPFLPFGQVEATEDLRLKYRYLDLRTKKLQDILALRSRTTNTVRALLTEENFIEVETPILYKSTPEGARDYVVPSRVHAGKVYALPQSPQTLKQLLMIGSTDKYFQICRCFRDEDLRADRQPEFTQIDMEISFATQEYVKNVVEKILKNLFKLSSDFVLPMMTYDEALTRYGSDKPDLRFALEHKTVTDIFKDSDFSVFSSVAKEGGLIKAIFVPMSNGTFSRKDTDALTDVVKPHGGKGVAFFKVTEGARSGGISKFVTDEIYSELCTLEEKSGDGTWLFCASADRDTTHSCADALRRHLGKKLNLIEDGYKFLWVYDFPLLEWNADDKRYIARHHPFTMVKSEQRDAFMAADPKDPEALKDMPSEAYDVVCNGYELGGGSIRIHEPGVQKKMFEVLGMSEAEVKHQFGFFVEALNYGVPPHGGLAFGLDRIIMMLAKTESIRDVIAFPKTSSASDIMAEAPSAPGESQLRELHFNWTK